MQDVSSRQDEPLPIWLIPFLTLLLIVFLPSSGHAQSNGVLREVWFNIGGNSVADLTNHPSFPNNPGEDSILTSGFEAPTDVYESYGQRLRALLIPPATGTYVFLIASDDNSQLYLGTNDSPGSKRLIARVDGWTPSREYHVNSSQKSSPISLVAGQRYYLEALMKEGGGGDNLAVTWQLPGQPEPADQAPPIPNSNLIPYGVGPPAFAVHPANLTVVEGSNATFNVQLERSLGATLQWVRNGTNIAGATNASFAFGPVRLADSGNVLYCRASNSYGATNSQSATLTVSADVIRPTIAYAACLGNPTSVTVGFSELVDSATASVAANYALNNGVSVISAKLLEDGATVVLKTSPLSWQQNYLLTVNNIRDLAQTPNTILPNTQRTLTLTFTPLPVQDWSGIQEPPGPCSRRTPFSISEILYYPAPRTDGRNLEFIEIYNSNPWAEDLGGYRISGAVDYVFPAGTTIPSLGYRVVAANPSDLQSVYGLTDVLGPMLRSPPGSPDNCLDNGGGTLRLRDELDAVLIEIEYDDDPPWPGAADGAGHSLVLARPSYGEADPRAWGSSDVIGGSPGLPNPSTVLPARQVLINEILAHTDPPQMDFIELFNYGSSSVDIGGCVLTDDPATNRYVFPVGTSISGRGFLALTQAQLGFALSADGETLYFKAADGSRILHTLRYKSQENGVAFGRFPDGAAVFRRLSAVTLGTNNAPPGMSEVVINEIQYHPGDEDSDSEFVELYNRGTQSILLDNWRLSGGISYTFPAGTILPGGGYLVVARNPTNLLATHPGLIAAQALGPFNGQLSNGGDQIQLDKPDDLISTNLVGQWTTNKIHIVVDEVTYGTGGRWGRWSDGNGSSLERTDPRASGHLAPSWRDSDETAKSSWTTVEFTGLLDHGAMTSGDQLQMFLLGAGECLVDQVEVIGPEGTNIVINGTFDNNTAGWFFQGTHEQSVWRASGGFNGACLHVVATDRGDTGANRIRTVLARPLQQGQTATLRAKVRWLGGHPEFLLRLRGNWLEATGNILATRNLGTPGFQNTRFLTNTGPAVTEVRHSPVLPGAGVSVTVTAQIEDPDSLAQAILKYRVDPATNFASVPMAYRGAGFYSGVIPGQPSGTRVAFHIETRDGATPTSLSRFPQDAPSRECLVGFGESVPAGNLGTYRLWVTQRNVTRWATREKQSNVPLDATFAYGAHRVVYNVSALYSGSPFHTPGYDSPNGSACDYDLTFAKDDRFLGTEDFVLATLGNLNSDPTCQAEQAAFWITRKLGTPYLHRRYIRLFFNGQLRGSVYEDAQQPNSDVVRQFFPGDSSGSLHKIEDWFEFNDTGDNMLGNIDATLENFTTTGGMKKTARYRWNWRPRAARESANAFTNLFALVDGMNAVQPEPYRSSIADLVDVEEFMRVLAMERIVGNWDSYGYARGKNMFAYKPTGGPWALLPWDVDFVFSSGGSSSTDPLFGGNEPVLNALREFPEFQRAYWRAFQDAVNGPLLPANLWPHLDARYNALLANGVGASSPQALKDYAAQRRSYIVSQLASVASPFTVNPVITVSNGLGVISGTAPIEAFTININGAAWTLRWISLNNWTATVPLQTGSNHFSIVAVDNKGTVVPGASNATGIVYAPVPPSPAGFVVINEIMFNPAQPGAEYVELHNTSPTQAFDLSGWTFNGLSYTFRNGIALPPRGFLILVKNRAVFNAVYGPEIAVFDEYSGNLQSKGETLSLLKPSLPEGAYTLIDRVRYDETPPWPDSLAGASLQLRDPGQDNSRVANWARAQAAVTQPQSLTLLAYTNAWRFMQSSNLDGVSWNIPAFADGLWPTGSGLLAYEDNPAITNLIRTRLQAPGIATNNAAGGHAYYFRTRVVLSNDLTGFTVTAGAYIDDGAVIYVNGTEAARVRMPAGVVSNLTTAIDQPPSGDALNPDSFLLDPALFGFGTNVIAVEVHQNQLASSDITFGLNLVAETPGGSNTIALATPGRSNSVLTILPAFPSLWLNEVHPQNLSGPVDNFGQREPWVELFNSGSNSVSLAGYFLSDNYTNLTQWAFPSNSTVPAGGFLVVWCDAQTNQSSGGALHTVFRPGTNSGHVALSRLVSGKPQIVDYLSYTNLQADWSYGDTPDGQPFYRGQMFSFTPGNSNNAASPPITLFLNEWMADNTRSLADPADNNFEDWFEIYNPGNEPVDLGGCYLTDNLTNKTQFLVPIGGNYVVPARGFLLVWADNETAQNSTNQPDLHASFALGKSGDAIGLFASDGTPIDTVSFGTQTSDVCQGRYADGSPAIITLSTPTPRAPNVLPNTAPSLQFIPDMEVTLGQTLTFTAQATDSDLPPQLLTYSLGSNAPAGALINSITGQFQWTPSTTTTPIPVTIVSTDNGIPPLTSSRTFHVTVHAPPTVTIRIDGNQLRIDWPRGTLQEAVEAIGPYRDVTSVSPVMVDLTESMRFYRIRL